MNSNKNNWIKYSVIVSEEFVEPVVQMFSRFLHGSVVVEKEGDPEDGINKESIVSGYVLKTKNSKELEKNLNSGLSYLAEFLIYLILRLPKLVRKSGKNKNLIQ